MSGDAGTGAWPDDPQERLLKLAHDLRTPLVVVKGFSELLASRADLAEAQRDEFLQRLLAGAQELVDILDAERATRRFDEEA